MSKFQWLKDYQEIEERIAYLEDNLSRSKSELARWVNGDLAKYKLTAESDGARLEEKIEVIEIELAHKMNDLNKLKSTVSKFKGLEQKIVFGKYIEGKTLEVIAEELSYSPQYIYNRHAQLKKMVAFAEIYNS